MAFRIHRNPDYSLPRQLRIRGENQYVELAGLSRGSRLARISLHTADGRTLGLTAQIESRLGDNRCSLAIFPDDPNFSHVPVARGEIKNAVGGFVLDVVGTEWLLDLARNQSLHQRTSAEFVFQVPVRRPSSGELNFVLSTWPLDPADGSWSEAIVSPR